MRIALRMPNWLGDAVMASVVISQIIEKWPKAQIYIWAKPSICSLFKDDPRIFSFIELKRTAFSKFNPFRQDIKELRSLRLDLIIILTNSFSSIVESNFIRSKKSLGYVVGLHSWFLSNPIKPKAHLHHMFRYQGLLSELFPNISKNFAPKLYVGLEDELWAEHVIQGKKFITFHPSAAYGETKCWPLDRYEQLIDKLVQKGLHVFIVGDDQAYKKTAHWQTMFNHQQVINLAGQTTLGQLMAICKKSSIVVSGDSGPLHVAAALAPSAIGIFGSTDPSKTAPVHNCQIVYEPTVCSPCFKRHCTIGLTCLKNISVEKIYSLIFKHLNENA